MKKILFISLAVLASVAALQPAAAADMPVKARPVALFSWTGFYAGVHAGYGWSGSADATVTPSAVVPPGAFVITAVTAPFTLSTRPRGWLAGVLAGYNLQINQIVLGIEADGSFSGVKDSDSGPYSVEYRLNNITTVDGLVTLEEKLKWLATLRARAGLLLTQRLLAYVTGGVAWGRVDLNLSSTSTATTTPPGTSVTTVSSASSNETRWGHAIGGGLEWAATNAVMLRGEYLFIGLRNNVTLTVPEAVATSSHMNLHIARGAIVVLLH